MSLPLGKLAILVGAGFVGSVLAKDSGGISNVTGFMSDALKVVYRQLRQDNSGSSKAKPQTDGLMQQVNSLREELQRLAPSRSVTIVTSSGSGSSKYGVVVIVVVVGYGYIWWKGWKLSDMMFATRRGLTDACTGVAKQLEGVYSSISATKRHLSSRIDRVDGKIDECADNTAATRDEVTELRGDVKLIGTDVHSVHQVVRSLETKISRIEGRQNETNFGVGKLIAFVRSMEGSRPMVPIEGAASGSFTPSLELPPPSPTAKARSLSLTALPEPPSPSNSNGIPKRPLQTAASASAWGLKELQGISSESPSKSSNPQSPNGVQTSGEAPSSNETAAAGGSGFLGRTFSGISASFLTRRQSFK